MECGNCDASLTAAEMLDHETRRSAFDAFERQLISTQGPIEDDDVLTIPDVLPPGRDALALLAEDDILMPVGLGTPMCNRCRVCEWLAEVFNEREVPTAACLMWAYHDGWGGCPLSPVMVWSWGQVFLVLAQDDPSLEQMRAAAAELLGTVELRLSATEREVAWVLAAEVLSGELSRFPKL